MWNEEWSPAAIVNEELRILHSNIAAKRESFNIQHSTFNIKIQHSKFVIKNNKKYGSKCKTLFTRL